MMGQQLFFELLVVKSVTLSKGSRKERTKRWEMTKIGRGGGRSVVRSSVYNTIEEEVK